MNAPFKIAAISQTAGRIGGGSCVHIFAEGDVRRPKASVGELEHRGGREMVWTSPDRTAEGPGTYEVTITNGDRRTAKFYFTALEFPKLNERISGGPL